MTTKLNSIKASILFSALFTFALIIGQPQSSNASDHLVMPNEIIDHVYTPVWAWDIKDPLAGGEFKAMSRNSGEHLNIPEEVIDHVYTPVWAWDNKDPLAGHRGDTLADSRHAGEHLNIPDEVINNVYTPVWAWDLKNTY